MTEFDVNSSTTTNLNNEVQDYSVPSKALDSAGDQKETVWEFTEAAEYFGYYKTIPELRQAIKSLAMWTTGKGYTTDSAKDQIVLDNIRGWGEDSFDSICSSLIITKKVVGDSFAEIIRNPETGTLINLKPISPERMRIVTNRQGIIQRYETKNKEGVIKFQPSEILHLCNDRIADEIHGTSVIESCKWVIDSRNEAMETYKRIMKRSLALGVLYVDTEDTAKLNHIKQQYKVAVDKGEVLVLPNDIAEIRDTKVTVQDFVTWIQYLENVFYEMVGVPKTILGGTQSTTEASSKIGYLVFEQVYMAEQRLLEQDIWNQLAIKLTFNRPVSLKDNVQEDEAANTGQTGFQPNETQVGVTRNE